MKTILPLTACLLLTVSFACTQEAATEEPSAYNEDDYKPTVLELKPAGPLYTKKQIEHLASLHGEDVSPEEIEAVKARFARINALEPSEEVKYGFRVAKTYPVNTDSAATRNNK